MPARQAWGLLWYLVRTLARHPRSSLTFEFGDTPAGHTQRDGLRIQKAGRRGESVDELLPWYLGKPPEVLDKD